MFIYCSGIKTNNRGGKKTRINKVTSVVQCLYDEVLFVHCGLESSSNSSESEDSTVRYEKDLRKYKRCGVYV